MKLCIGIFLLGVVGFVVADEYFDRIDEREMKVDECANVKCRTGEWCNQGKCECQDSCPSEWDNYDRQLCVDGTTYRHECDLWRNQCYCRTGDPRCGGEAFNNHRANDESVIKYFDECRDLSGLCDWEQQEDTFALRLGMWFQELLRQKWSSGSGYPDDESLLRPMDSKARAATTKLMSQTSMERVNGGVISYWFCEMDRRNKGSLDQRDLSLLYQVLLPSNSCLESFMNRCSSSGSISFDQWHNCFEVPQEERIECSRFK
ncbi:Secreted Protein Acidic and Cysteine Rich [Fasciola hepatica]|uniref:Secreted Protein Acidic and Cysteine Rich n=1 Tax=Fasciola hepatica TaxID=6192 RepID=A0A4E0RGJ0_FASHE|nr:Secreted Protein Acidic and Cysteine Rich [Fasciola hepatica]